MTPAFANPMVYPLGRHPKFASPLGHGETLPVEGDANVLPRVVLLGLVSGPAAVVLGVASRAVNSIEAMTHWAITHVGIEHLKRFPRWVVSNAATAVSCVVRMLRVAASLLHPAPGVVCQRSGLSVGHISLGSDFFPKTTARLGMPAFELPGLRRCAAPAFTGTVPLTPADVANCGQSGEAHSCNVDESHGVNFNLNTSIWV